MFNVCMHKSCINIWNHIGMTCIISATIHMWEIKIYWEFYHGIVYIANEGCNIKRHGNF